MNRKPISLAWLQITTAEDRQMIWIVQAFIFSKSRDGGSEIVWRIWLNLVILEGFSSKLAIFLQKIYIQMSFIQLETVLFILATQFNDKH